MLSLCFLRSAPQQKSKRKAALPLEVCMTPTPSALNVKIRASVSDFHVPISPAVRLEQPLLALCPVGIPLLLRSLPIALPTAYPLSYASGDCHHSYRVAKWMPQPVELKKFVFYCRQKRFILYETPSVEDSALFFSFARCYVR